MVNVRGNLKDSFIDNLFKTYSNIYSLNELCDFENDDFCNWNNVQGSNLDWKLRKGPAPFR
jgi:hypothetical protein